MAMVNGMVNGWKFLTPYGTTERAGQSTVYPLPGPGEKWGPWFTHPDKDVIADGVDCGPGGYHVMKHISGPYAPHSWWIWYVQARADDILGQSSEKFRARSVRLRRVSQETFWRIIRLGWCALSDLSWADLRLAWLHGANLSGANLIRADLSGADLRGANLSRVDLRAANLHQADLRGADLSGACLAKTNLNEAKMSGVILYPGSLDEALGVSSEVLAGIYAGARK